MCGSGSQDWPRPDWSPPADRRGHGCPQPSSRSPPLLPPGSLWGEPRGYRNSGSQTVPAVTVRRGWRLPGGCGGMPTNISSPTRRWGLQSYHVMVGEETPATRPWTVWTASQRRSSSRQEQQAQAVRKLLWPGVSGNRRGETMEETIRPLRSSPQPLISTTTTRHLINQTPPLSLSPTPRCPWRRPWWSGRSPWTRSTSHSTLTITTEPVLKN